MGCIAYRNCTVIKCKKNDFLVGGNLQLGFPVPGRWAPRMPDFLCPFRLKPNLFMEPVIRAISHLFLCPCYNTFRMLLLLQKRFQGRIMFFRGSAMLFMKALSFGPNASPLFSHMDSNLWTELNWNTFNVCFYTTFFTRPTWPLVHWEAIYQNL